MKYGWQGWSRLQTTEGQCREHAAKGAVGATAASVSVLMESIPICSPILDKGLQLVLQNRIKSAMAPLRR